MIMNKTLFNNLHKLTIKDCFDLYIHKFNNYNYKFKNEKIEVSGFGYYDKKYPKQGDHRFYLELSIEQRKEGETLAVIMMNPSNTFPEIEERESTVDDTVKNIIRMAYKLKKYNRIIILNSFSLISGTIKNIKEDDCQTKNIEIINFFINTNKEIDYLLAWGSKAVDIDNIKNYLKNIDGRRIFVYKMTLKKAPCHPSIRVENRYKYVSEFLNQHDEKSSFIPYKIIN